MTTRQLSDPALELAYLKMIGAVMGWLPPDPIDPRQQWDALVAAKQATGLSRVAAIQAAAKAQPALYEQQAVRKGEYRR